MTRNFPPGEIRVSDADRDAAITELSQHFQAGRLTQEEFDERSGLALRARTGNDLSELFTDLPQLSPGPQSPGPSPVPPWAPEPWPARPVGRRGRSFPPVLAGVIAVIVVSNIAGDISGGVHHPVFSWVIIVVILLVIIRIARRARRLPPRAAGAYRPRPGQPAHHRRAHLVDGPRQGKSGFIDHLPSFPSLSLLLYIYHPPWLGRMLQRRDATW